MEKVNLLVATSSQNYINQALDELRAYDKTLAVVKNTGNGIMIVRPSVDKHDFNDILLDNKPIFIRHINTVDYSMDVSLLKEEKYAKTMLEPYLSSIHTEDKLAVQIRMLNSKISMETAEIRNMVDSCISKETGVIPVVKEPDKIMSIFIADEACYIGMSKAEKNISGWSGGMVHYKKSDEDISRAKFKLMEAIYVFNIDMSSIRRALDLGASPGGWTSVLLEKGIEVTAVDTGELDDRLFKYPQLTFIKGNAAELKLPNDSFDLLTSDISWNAVNTAKMVLKCSDTLKSGGLAVVTVKLMSSKVTRIIKDVKKIYDEAFYIMGIRQLFHNRDEVTMYMKKR
ncbi:MAG: SAM-dependent methyltransferase [Bacillota bacterium]